MINALCAKKPNLLFYLEPPLIDKVTALLTFTTHLYNTAFLHLVLVVHPINYYLSNLLFILYILLIKC